MKKIYYSLALLAFSLSFCSCSDDDDDSVPGGNQKPDVNPDPQTLVFSYDKFLNKNDVQITSNDTTKIVVNKKFLELNNLNADVHNDTVPLVVWRTMNTAPFVRNVVKSTDLGDKIELTTIKGDIADVFPDTEFNLETDVHINPNEARMISRGGGRASVNPNRYIDEQGDIHPAVYLVEEGITELDEDGKPVRGSRALENKVFSAEDLFEENADFNILNINHKFDDRDFNLYKKGDVNVKFYAKDMSVRARSGLRINVNTRWFKLKYFECVAYGDFSAHAKLGFLATANHKFNFNRDIARLSSCTSVFWVGWIPVAVRTNVGLKTVGSANLSAKCDISTTLDCNAGFTTGVEYTGSWHPVLSGNFNSNYGLNLATDVELKANADVAALIYANISLYGFGGPGVEVGPRVQAGAGAEMHTVASTHGSSALLKANYNAQLSVGGAVTANLHIWKWNLGSWSTPFTLWKSKRYEGSWEKKF